VTPARWVAAVGVCALVAALAITLLHHEPRRSGTNLTPAGAFVIGLAHGQQACQESELLPADTAAIRLTAGTRGQAGPPLEATVTGAGGRVLTSGRLPGGWHQGTVGIPVARVRSASEEARVCIRDAGSSSSGPIELAGNTQLGWTMQVAGHAAPNVRLRFDYMRPGSEDWYQLLPTIAHRFSLGKAGFLRHWEWVAALLLILATVVVALATVLRSASAADPRP
jgi:hypothetical protein